MKVVNKKSGQISLAYFKTIGLELITLVDGKVYNKKKFEKIYFQIDPTESYIKINGLWEPVKKK